MVNRMTTVLENKFLTNTYLKEGFKFTFQNWKVVMLQRHNRSVEAAMKIVI